MTVAAVNFGDGFVGTGQTNSLVVGPYSILGGKYAMFGYSSGTYNAQLKVMTADATNYVAVAAADTSGYVTYDLPPGPVEIVLGGSFSTGNVSLVRIPYHGI
jgi:hypothetical protein